MRSVLRLGRTWVSASLLGACTFALRPPAALADPSPTAPVVPLSDSLTGEAKSEYDAALLLFGDSDYAGAAAKFRRAYELSADPRLLWNVAACEKELRHYARANGLVERYLAEGGDRLTPENRQNANATREALRGFFSRLTLTRVTPGAQVFVDDALVGTAPLGGPLEVDLGQRKIRVEHAGDEPFERVLDVPGSSEMTLDVLLKPLPLSAHLAVSSEPDAVIRVDGSPVGNGRWQGTVAPGRHLVRVEATGKKPFVADLELAPRQNRTVDVHLSNAEKQALWPWIAGGAAVVAGAVIGGYFLVHKDESGSAPQGALGTVYLPLGVR